MLFRSNDTATTEIYTVSYTLSLHDALPIALLVLAVIAFLIIRRQRYVRALRGRGWTFESRPALESVLDHHAPPFGLGFEREVDEAVSGTTAAGVPFRVFEYATSEGGSRFDERIASMQLPLPLPDLFRVRCVR